MATPTSVRYSDGKPQTDKSPNFSWEYPLPENRFWSGLPFVVGRNFLSNFSAEEIEHLPIDPNSTLGKDKKLELLLDLLKRRLAEKDLAAAPETYYDFDFAGWDKLWLGIFTMQDELGYPEAEQTTRMMCDRRKNKSNLSHFHTLAGILVAKGEYVEGEEMERKVKYWLEERLGKDSPQALGASRIIIKAVWKQGLERRREAEELVDDTRQIIRQMGNGQFGVYQQMERDMFENLVEGLQKGE
ncbi:hypothetical protein VE03_03478 [Pseudogymnoascus sp. 23342-1-I1]|nr:hypothetical protein VE03_03478 [Pseudogymnoascus sp. 23342-1-I1]